MANQEGLGRGGISRIGAPPRERTGGVRVVTRPTTEPAPGHEQGKHPKEKTPPSSKKALIARLAGSLLALTGIAGPAVDHHINHESELTPPAVGRDIASVPGFYWDLGKGTVEDIQRIVYNKNKLPEIAPEATPVPTAVPTAEIPEVIIPKSFTTTETTKKEGKATIAEGIILEGVNTTRLTEENIESIIENNPDSYSPENWDPYVMTNKHIFIAVESDKPVIVRSGFKNSEIYRIEDDGSQTPIRFIEATDLRLTLNKGDVLKLFTSNPVEIFQRPPLIVNGEEYLVDFFVVETLPNGRRLVYMISLAGNSLTGDYARADAWKLSDEFKNAPEATIFSNEEKLGIPNIYDAKDGIKAEIRTDENGNIISPDLLEIMTDGTIVSISPFGNIRLDPYLTEENGDTKLIKPS